MRKAMVIFFNILQVIFILGTEQGDAQLVTPTLFLQQPLFPLGKHQVEVGDLGGQPVLQAGMVYGVGPLRRFDAEPYGVLPTDIDDAVAPIL